MRILFIGDIFGKPGRKVLEEKLPHLIRQHDIEFCIANGENAAGGFGITPQIADELLESEIDLLTSGNHVWDKRQIIQYLDLQPRLLRPHNYPSAAPGTGVFVGKTRHGIPIGVMNIQGRVFMPALDCPFAVSRSAVEQIRRQTNTIIVDVHAEATSEKQALGWYLDGQVSAIIGTHTHVQTADERILPKGTAYITDVGMTGPHDSIIGSVPELALNRFLRQMPIRLEPALGNIRLCAVLLEIDETNGMAKSIERLNLAASL
jgi:2',3'-cyclic-nucleotide 2'-phosphodiesterase